MGAGLGPLRLDFGSKFRVLTGPINVSLSSMVGGWQKSSVKGSVTATSSILALVASRLPRPVPACDLSPVTPHTPSHLTEAPNLC